MPAKINKHVFHGIYSNFGYKPELAKSDGSIERMFSDYPIHFFRASFAEKENADSSDLPKEFQTEEEVLKWYKKRKYGESQFNKLKFPEHICKNYFTIPESEFYKYKNLFNGMIKGIKINSNIEIKAEGTAITDSCPICKKVVCPAPPSETAGPFTIESPFGAAYFTVVGGADDIGYLNGKQITDGGTSSSFNQDLIPKTKASSLTFSAKNTVPGNVGIEATVQFYKPIDFSFKFNCTVNFDSTKIHDFPEVQKRLSANKIQYEASVDLDEEEENQNKEELRVYQNTVFNSLLFKDQWEFDRAIFKGIFQTEPNKFNYNATFINDPVILPNPGTVPRGGDPKYETTNYPAYIKNTFSFSPGLIDSAQKNFTKSFTKFGNVSFNISNNNFAGGGVSNLNFYISAIFYIKKQKKFLCFVEWDMYMPITGTIKDKKLNCNNGCEDVSVCSSSSSSSGDGGSSGSSGGGECVGQHNSIPGVGSGLDMLNIISSDTKPGILQKYFMIDGPDIESIENILESKTESQDINQNSSEITSLAEEESRIIALFIPVTQFRFTTDDTVNDGVNKYKPRDCAKDSEQIKIEYKKSVCNFTIFNQKIGIEYFELKDSEFIIDNSTCNDIKPPWDKDKKSIVSINKTQPLSFEIMEWKDSDFDEKNQFPNKVT